MNLKARILKHVNDGGELTTFDTQVVDMHMLLDAHFVHSIKYFFDTKKFIHS